MIDREPVLDLLALLAQPPVGTSTTAKFRPRGSPLVGGQHDRDLIYVSYAEEVNGKPPEKPLATRGTESPLLVPRWLQDPPVRLGVDAILHATFAMHVKHCSHCPSLQSRVHRRDCATNMTGNVRRLLIHLNLHPKGTKDVLGAFFNINSDIPYDTSPKWQPIASYMCWYLAYRATQHGAEEPPNVRRASQVLTALVRVASGAYNLFMCSCIEEKGVGVIAGRKDQRKYPQMIDTKQSEVAKGGGTSQANEIDLHSRFHAVGPEGTHTINTMGGFVIVSIPADENLTLCEGGLRDKPLFVDDIYPHSGCSSGRVMGIGWPNAW